jgi:O-antigen biosynthesis protein
MESRPGVCGVPRRVAGPSAVHSRAAIPRARIDGKFLALGDERLWIRGVTYGTFAEAGGHRFGSPAQVERDFGAMAAHGINAVRTYTAPPRDLLDIAQRHGLHVMVGLSWEQHIAFLDDRAGAASIVDRVRAQAATCAGHPAVLSFAVGNEIPTPIVRWHGRRRVERFIERLCKAVRAEDADALLTYVNYPSTEYLRLPFVDFLSFNVYLDDRREVSKYLARLQNLAGEKPLLIAEIGADSIRQGVQGQAEAVGSQVEAAFSAGCAGTFVFAWTDEWHRGEDEVLDWDFGVTDRARRPKPALSRLREQYRQVDAPRSEGPHVSVVVCSQNGAATLGACLAGIAALRYPSFETIVVDDGSTDATAAIASGFDVQVISTENQGLSAARNVGLLAARGEIVAYLDDDACPDQDWLHFLVEAFNSTDHAAVGGPNLPPGDDGAIAICVANAPGGPIHVLISDTEAEHIPGCNMAYRREALLAIDGFDPQFRAAGDDVDVCWRLHERGETLGFHAAAVVWHRRRKSVRAFWRQQRGYGHAEALLERKWPERYNRRGHLTWAGRLYDRASARAFRPTRIYHGTWGTGAFQPEEELRHGPLMDLVGAPEWYLVLGTLAALSLLSLLWGIFVWVLPLLVLGASASLVEAVHGGRRADLGRHGRTAARRLVLRTITTFLHLLQPAARLTGRLSQGLSPWRQRRTAGVALPRPSTVAQWHESWLAPRERVARIEDAARQTGARVVRGGPYARWDLEISGGAAGSTRLLTSVEDHGRGRQLVRSRLWPHITPAAWRTAAGLAVLAVAAGLTGHSATAATLSGLLATLTALVVWECSTATAAAVAAVALTADLGPSTRFDLVAALTAQAGTKIPTPASIRVVAVGRGGGSS